MVKNEWGVGKRVHVDYFDLLSFADWKSITEIEQMKLPKCAIEGELVINNHEFIIVCAESCDNGDKSCGTMIPHGVIDKIEYLD